MKQEKIKKLNNHKMTVEIKKMKLFLLCGSLSIGVVLLNSTSFAETSTKNNQAQKVVTISALKALTAEEISIKSYNTSKVSDSVSDSIFRLINASGQERVRETTGETKLIPDTQDNMRVVTFKSPSDVKGIKNLLIEHSKKEDDMWIYLPAMKKVRRLQASNKRDSFVGTDFSYGDVIGHRPEDWLHKLIKEEKIDNKDCYILESIPKNNEIAEASGYSKRVAWIEKESFVAVKVEMYDLSSQLLKKLSAQKIEKVDEKNNKWQPMILSAENVQTNHKTILEFKNFKANVGVSDDKFTTRFLEK